MSDYDGTILFKEWLPDQPELGNPGLTEAKNAEPYDEVFASFSPLNDSGGATLSSRPLGYLQTDLNGTVTLYVGTQTRLYASTEGAQYTTLSATLSTLEYWDLDRYENLVLATSLQDGAKRHTLGSASNFSTMSADAPKAAAIGVIGQFVFLGNTSDTANGLVPYRVQWSGIDNPSSFPTPNSATAIAQQSGEQFLDGASGDVTSIGSGDQFGLIFQLRAITRATYIGPPAVFQFDRISDVIGTPFPRSVIKKGNEFFFISSNGVFKTDGASILDIGAGKVDNWFTNNLSGAKARVIGAINPMKSLIYWTFPTTASDPNEILIYNYKTNRFAHAQVTNTGIISTLDRGTGVVSEIGGFGASFTQGSFSGTPGAAILTSGELEPNAGGYSVVQGIKPLADQTLNGITVAMGTRNDRSSAVSYTAEQTANSRSGFANFRTAAKYHRARLTISGTFNSAQGLEYQAVPDGYT